MRRLAALLCALALLCPCVARAEFAVHHGDRSQKRVCITVDDCADTEMLRAIFELGQELEVPITFFTLGYVIKEADAPLWRQIAQSDCEIGNHGYYHKSLPKLKHAEMVKNLTDMQQRLNEVLGFDYPVRVMRPPYGAVRLGKESNLPVVKGAKAAGYEHAILWDVSQTDAQKCLPEVQNGSILLFHTLKKDLECLRELLPALQEQGYEFVTVSDMLQTL